MRTNDLIPLITYIPLVQFGLQNVNTLIYSSYTAKLPVEFCRPLAATQSRQNSGDKRDVIFLKIISSGIKIDLSILPLLGQNTLTTLQKRQPSGYIF